MTTILLYGNDKFCSVCSDTQITDISTLKPTNGLPKVIKVSNNIIIAMAGNVECFVKIFGWEYLKFPARKREFKRHFNNQFPFKHADECFAFLKEFVKNNIQEDCTIFVIGKSSDGGMVYGKINACPFRVEYDVSTLQLFKYSTLPHDLDKDENLFRYDSFMENIDRVAPPHVDSDDFIAMVQKRQIEFLNQIAEESRFSNNEHCIEKIKID